MVDQPRNNTLGGYEPSEGAFQESVVIYRKLASATRRQVILLQGALIAVFLASMAGPWFYDEIMVPAQFACSAPFIRLEGDFCGLPMSGFRLITLFLGALLQIVLHGPGGSALSAMTFRDLAVTAAIIALVLPAITTTLRAVRSSSQIARLLSIASWLLAIPIALFIALPSSQGVSKWGVWLFIGLAIAALILESIVPAKDAPGIDPVSA